MGSKSLSTMYAVVETGGKQYRVQKGSVFHVEKLPGNAGDSIQLDNVLLIGGDKFTVGTPRVANAAVLCKIKSQGKDKKIIVFRYKRREGFRKKIGHRQCHTELEVVDIDLSAKAKPTPVAPKIEAEVKKQVAPKVSVQKPVEAQETAKVTKPVTKKLAAPVKKKTAAATKTPKVKTKTAKKPTPASAGAGSKNKK